MPGNPSAKPDMNEKDACLHTMQYINSSMVAFVMDRAIELDIFGVITRAGPGAQPSSREIASQFSMGNSNHVSSRLDGMLRPLVTHACLTCSLSSLEDGSEHRVYGLSPASRFLIQNQEEGSLAPMIALLGHPASQVIWSYMKDTIIEGENQFEKHHGMSEYHYSTIDPTLSKTFNEAVGGFSTITIRKILEIYKGFKELTSLVDVGGGSGRILSIIISEHPSIKGINYDLPHVVQDEPSRHVVSGIEHIGGDMFVDVPHGDAILLMNVLHNWSDEHCLKLLKMERLSL